MLNQLAHLPLPVWITVIVVGLLCLASGSTSSRRRAGVYRPQGPSRSFDECFPEQPTRVRHGVVAERKEVMLPQYTLSAIQRPHPTMVPHYAFTIICHDVIGDEKLEITAEKDGVNVFADVGLTVEVKSQLSRLDYHHMVHSISAV